MLVKYKKSCKKIAMGLLSLMPKEKNIKILLQSMQLYEENPSWQLYFWKQGDAFVAVAGIEHAENHFIIHHLAVNPSYQGEGIGHAMIEQIQQMLPLHEMEPTAETAEFLDKYAEKKAALI